MLCEKCAGEAEHTTCTHCGKEVARLGPYCYVCGNELTDRTDHQEQEHDDLSNRILCSDGTCIGVIDEKGFCRECGKPYTPESQ
jgi:predicted amidophosphoribosyltransferase